MHKRRRRLLHQLIRDDEEAGALSLVTWASVGRVAARRCPETLGGERWRSQLCRMTRAESQHDLYVPQNAGPI